MMLLVLRLRLKKVSKTKKNAVTVFLLSTVLVVSIPKKPYLQFSLAKVNFYAQNSVGLCPSICASSFTFHRYLKYKSSMGLSRFSVQS